MAIEDLIKLKQKLGTKVYNSTILGQKSAVKSKVVPKTEFKRENKNRPREMSTKRPVPIGRKKKVHVETFRDPRFDPNCGDFDRKDFKERFSFVNEIKAKEIDDLKDELKQCPDAEQRKTIKLLIQRLENQAREESRRQHQEQSNVAEKEKIQEERRDGKLPIFASKKKRKIHDLVTKFKELKDTGKLQKHLEKRRKKNLARDRKRLDLPE